MGKSHGKAGDGSNGLARDELQGVKTSQALLTPFYPPPYSTRTARKLFKRELIIVMQKNKSPFPNQESPDQLTSM